MDPSTGLPQPVTLRSAASSDLQGILELRQTLEQADSGAIYTTAAQLAAEWEALGTQLGAQAWVAVSADDVFCGCAELVRSGRVFAVRFWVASDQRGSGLERELFARAERQAYALGRAEGAGRVTLFAQATSAHPAAKQALLQAGFAVTSVYEEMELTLKESPMHPQVIDGIEIRPFASGQDASVIYHADEEAFQDERGHAPRTYEEWNRRLTQGGGAADRSLWLIAWDGDEVAGAALGEAVSGAGWIHHLFVRRPWRRRGLGEALTRSAVGAFFRHGVGSVRLNVDGQSLTNAHQLYRRVGFTLIGSYSNLEEIAPLA